MQAMTKKWTKDQPKPRHGQKAQLEGWYARDNGQALFRRKSF